MKISEKAALAMAGYTKAEIEAMEKPQPVPQPVPHPVPQPAPQPTPQPAPQYDGLETLLQQILQGQQTMTQTLQANALGLGIQQQPAVDAATVTARIIDPTYGTEVK